MGLPVTAQLGGLSARLIQQVLDERVEADPTLCPGCNQPLAVYGDEDGCMLCRNDLAAPLGTVLRRRTRATRRGGCKECGTRLDSRTTGCNACKNRAAYRRLGHRYGVQAA
jgi:hypothetical protein